MIRWIVAYNRNLQQIMITSLSEDVGRTSRRQTITPLDLAYHQLNQFIETINDKISNRIQLVQQVYLQDYKDHTSSMREELKQLRANLDSQIIQQRSSEKLFVLEEERDFFRAQVLKLNQEVNQYVEQNKQLKKKIADIEVQTANYKTIAFNYQKKIIKLQKELTQMANFKRQLSTPTLPLFQTLKQSEEQEQQQSANEAQRSPKDIQQTVTSHVNLFERRPNQVVRTKTYSKFESATKASIKKYQQSNERDKIINDCIKQIKKQIFYRSQEHKNNVNTPLFDQFGKVQFDKFTRTDKKQLVQSLLANQKILQQFNQFLLNRNSQVSASRMLKTKIGDDKFNEKFLSDLKRSFNKKMYELKANGEVGLKQGSERKRTRFE